MRRDARRWGGLLVGGLLGAAGCAGSPWTPAADPAHRDAVRQGSATLPDLAARRPDAPTPVTRAQEPPTPAAPITPVSLAGPATDASRTSRVRIAALVKDKPIYESEVREAIYQRYAELITLTGSQLTQRERQIRKDELDRLIERELILEDMFTKLQKMRPHILTELKESADKESKRKLDDFRKARNLSADDFKAALASQGLSYEGLKRQLEREYMKSEYVGSRVGSIVKRVNLADIREYYETHPDEFATPDKVEWLDLFVAESKFASRDEARRFAEQLVQRARQGEDFVALVKQYDHGDSSLRDGAGVGTKRGELRPADVEPVVWELKDGEVGGPVELGSGYHIVKVAKRDQAGRRPFTDEKVQNEIRIKLQNSVGDREYKRMIAELKGKIPFTVFAAE